MKTYRSLRILIAMVLTITFGVSMYAEASSATFKQVTKKTITCYKGTAVKKVTAVSPKCPAGWTIKKSVPRATAKPSVTPTKATGATVEFSGTYKGNLSLLWSDSDVKVTSLIGTSSDAKLGLTKLTGTGGSAPSEQCSLINGSGVLAGPDGNLNVKLDTQSQGCAEDASAPTRIVAKGNAIITDGTGKFVGATGTLKINISFSIKSTTAGAGESSAFTLTLIGSVATK